MFLEMQVLRIPAGGRGFPLVRLIKIRGDCLENLVELSLFQYI